MKNFLMVLLLIVAVGCCIFFVRNAVSIMQILENKNTSIVKNEADSNEEAHKPDIQEENVPLKEDGEFKIYVDEVFYNSFDTYEEALSTAQSHKLAKILQKNKSLVIWDNYPPFLVFLNTDDKFIEFDDFASAVKKAKESKRSFVYYRKDNSLIWSNAEALKTSIQLEAPVVMQNPELPRGCEVTSLSMLINYKGKLVSKLTLADQVKKVPFQFKQGGIVYHGNPYEGFVGDMKNARQNGYGVYHGPIHQLLVQYFPYSAVDLSGCEFKDLYYLLNRNSPVWIITNTSYKRLAQSEFGTWTTTSGPIKITSKEHAVLVTGYDQEYIYFNDPLIGKNKASMKEFIEAWEQMGRQAVAAVH